MNNRMRVSVLVMFLVSFYISFARAQNSINDSIPKYDYVCNEDRFRDLGLNMTDFIYCDQNFSYPVRVADLINRMTLNEKVAQLGDEAPGVKRIGLPPYNWWSEALHGVATTGHGTHFDSLVPGATSFPNVILTAATFNQTLWNTIGKVVSTEGRAMYNLGRAGLTFWSPNINVARDPRWGRILETPGEDPFIIGTYAINYVRGLQDIEGCESSSDPNSRPLKVSACCKHFSAYDLENFNGLSRLEYNAKVSEQDMVETFNRPFEMCVKEGDVSSVMCSFNQVNGIPTCADYYLLTELVRNDWDLHGYTVADCDSVFEIVDKQKFLHATPEYASALTLKAGMDLDCGKMYPQHLAGAVRQGLTSEPVLDRSLNNIYIVLMRLGFFDGIQELQSLGKNDICAQQHVELAADAARQGIVLLKNDNQSLPLATQNIKSLALIGPHANATKSMIGNYAGIPCKYISPLEGFASYGNVTYESGCNDVKCKSYSADAATNAAANADATLIFVGLSLDFEAEWIDRTNLLLPGYQTLLVNKVAEASKGPVTLVVMSGGMIDVTFALNNTKINSIIWVGYPGEQGGNAIADIVFGKYNPSGRLPITWYEADYIKNFPMTSMSLRPVGNYSGRTYKFFNGSTVFPFGYGLSYTTFKYAYDGQKKYDFNVNLNRTQNCHPLALSKPAPACPSMAVRDLTCDEEMTFNLTVSNIGNMAGDEVLLVYTAPPAEVPDTHIKQLVAFERVTLQAKENVGVSVVLNICKAFSIVDFGANILIPSGLHTVMVGDIKIPVQITFSR